MPIRPRNSQLATRNSSPPAFTLVELLVVIGLIALLISILVPTIARVRRAAWDTQSKALLAKLQSSIERYYQDFSAYPGVLPDSNRGVPAGMPYVGGPWTDMTVISPLPAGFNITMPSNKATAPGTTIPVAPNPGIDFNSITGANNLVLSLLGGLYYDTAATDPIKRIKYNPALVGAGPASLNPANLKANAAYIDTDDLSWGTAAIKNGHVLYNGAIDANDSPIPCFVDKFLDPMPILYMRARVGTTTGYIGSTWYSPDTTSVLNTPGQYDLAHIIGYTSRATNGAIGATSTFKGRINSVAGTNGLSFIEPAATLDKTDPKYHYPYDFSIYMKNPNLSETPTSRAPRAKDTYVLIYAGPDRVYGTTDDGTSFGPIAP